MRLSNVITLTLIATALAAPALWGQEQPTVAEVGYVPTNISNKAINVSTDITGETFAAMASRSTEQVLDRLVNITFVNADLENALRIIAKQMDLNIIIGPGVRGRTISLDLRDVPLRFALDSILQSNELGFLVERGGIVRIVPAEQIRPDSIERQTLVRKLNWVLSTQVEPILEEFVTTEGTLRSDPQSNSIIISDVPSRISDIDALIDQIDVPERQVMIEARLVDVSESIFRGTDFNFGIGRLDRQQSSLADAAGIVGGNAPRNPNFVPQSTFGEVGEAEIEFAPADALGVVGGALANPALAWTYGTNWFGYDVSVYLDALEEEGLARVLAAPRVATLNNVPAVIDIKREVPYVEAVQGPTEGTITNEVEFKDVGLELQVVPTITNNGYIRMEIRTEQLIEAGRTFNIPIVDRRTTRTNVIVEDGNTVALGGLRQLEATNGESGVPWFRKLPAIGWMFRGDSFSRDRLDFYVFVTPKIITDPVMAAAERYAHDLLDLEWDLPRDFYFEDMEIETTY